MYIEGASHTVVLWVFHGSVAGSELHYLNNVKNCIWDPLVILCMDANGLITWHWPPSHVHVVNWLFGCLDSLVMWACTQIGVMVQVWFGKSRLWFRFMLTAYLYCCLTCACESWLLGASWSSFILFESSNLSWMNLDGHWWSIVPGPLMDGLVWCRMQGYQEFFSLWISYWWGINRHGCRVKVSPKTEPNFSCPHVNSTEHTRKSCSLTRWDIERCIRAHLVP